MISRWLLLILVLCPVEFVSAQDWPQFLGPNRNGTYPGPSLSITWAGENPKLLWQRDVGEGFAGPVVVGERLLLFHRVDDFEVLEALDVKSGQTIWKRQYLTNYRDDFGFDEGPRSVPVVSDDIVVTFGAQGHLSAVDIDNGNVIWEMETQDRFGVRKGFFGAAGSPLVESGRVVLNIGGEGAGIVAVDLVSGEILWTATSDEASYSSPVSASFDDERHAIFLTRDGLVGIDPIDGDVRFRKRWRSRLRASVNAATPLINGNLIFMSASYGTGAAVVQVNGTDVSEIWASDDIMSNHYSTSVLHDGYLYGFHGRQEYGQSFRAVDFATGKVQWSSDRLEAGSVTLAGDQLIVLQENGELVFATASPEEFVSLARGKILPGVIRAYPAIAKGLLFARNQDTLVCVDLRASF
tara:strand:- start:4844 stop:6073 length:1230 start_codon:yes stop_codon:yes gene_type:complete